MPRVPIYEQQVASLPGGSNFPQASADAFGASIGKAQEGVGRQIASAFDSLGSQLNSQSNEQEAIKSKVALSDHEAAVTQYYNDLKINGDPSQSALIPDQVSQFATQDWQKRSAGLGGKYANIAGANARIFQNAQSTAAQLFVTEQKNKYVEAQVGQAVSSQSARLMQDPTLLPQATAAINSIVAETSLPQWQQNQLKLKYAIQISDSVMQGFLARGDAAGAAAWIKDGNAQVVKQLGVKPLPAPVSGGTGINRNRVSAIDATPVGPIIDKYAAAYGVDPAAAKTMAHIESGGRPGAATGSYKGVYQLSDAEFAKYGNGGDIFNANDNIQAGVAALKAKSDAFAAKFGHQPSATELYMIHQQGEAGAENHYKNPDGLAWQNMLDTGEGRQKGEKWAKAAIWGNIPSDVKAQFPGGVDTVTSRDFISIWDAKVSGGKPTRVASLDTNTATDATSSAAPPTAPGTQVVAQDAKSIERSLSPAEMGIVKYHRDSIASGKVGRDEQGRPITVYSVTVQTEDGKYALIPGWFDGKIHTNDDEVYARWKSDIASGKFPVYDTIEQADQRAKHIHQIMDIEGDGQLTQNQPALSGMLPQAWMAHVDKQNTAVKQFVAEQARQVAEIRKHADDFLTQEQVAIKSQGAAGINPVLTEDKIHAIYGIDAPRIIDQRNAAMKYNAATAAWTADTPPAQIEADLATIDPKNINPQSPAFKSYVDNYKEAVTYSHTITAARDKAFKAIGDEAEKEIYARAQAGTLTPDYVEKIRPLITPTAYKAGLAVAQKKQTATDVAAVTDVLAMKETMDPEQFRPIINRLIADGKLDYKVGLGWVDDNQKAFLKDQPPGPYKVAEGWIKEKANPGLLSGAGETIMRGAQADMLVRLQVWRAANPHADFNQIMDAAQGIYEHNPMAQIYNNIKMRLGMSLAFPSGVKRDQVTLPMVEAAQESINRKRMADPGYASQWQVENNILSDWRSFFISQADTEQRAAADAKASTRKNPAAIPAPPVLGAPKKTQPTEQDLTNDKVNKMLGR